MWNFKGHLWNFTQNFEPIHNKTCILLTLILCVWVTISLNYDIISLSEMDPRYDNYFSHQSNFFTRFVLWALQRLVRWCQVTSPWSLNPEAVPSLPDWGPVANGVELPQGASLLPMPGSLQSCHNERDGILNHWHLDCLLNRLFRHTSKKTSKVHIAGVF